MRKRVHMRGLFALLLLCSASSNLADARTGVLDPSFGRHGLIRTDLGPGPETAVAMQALPSGSVLVAGSAGGRGGRDAIVVGHLPGGRLDPRFGVRGVARIDFGASETATALALGPDGTIVVAGEAVARKSPRRIFLARFGVDGQADPSFGRGGRLTLALGEEDARASALVVLEGGAVLVAGSTGSGPATRLLLARFTSAGRLDPNFGSDGVVRSPVLRDGARVQAMRVLEGGRIFLAGGDGGDFVMTSLREDGRIDHRFGDGGVARVDFDRGQDRAHGLAILSEGKLLLAGTTAHPGGADFAVARLTRDGTLDRTFGNGGRLRLDFGGWDRGQALLVQEDGFVVAGETMTDDGADIALVRLHFDGTLDRGFGRGGRVRTDLQSRADSAVALADFPRGRLLAAGVRGEGSGAEMALVAYREAAPECGDGFVEGAEVCDLGPDNGVSSCCSETCRLRDEQSVCRPSGGLCDPAEVCTGTSPICPEDEIAPAKRVCRPAAGACDLDERCSGLDKTCPADRVRDAEAVCRSAVGPCDAAERCDGESATCPSDAKATDICRPARSDCDLPERCDGTHDACPADRLQADGVMCQDRNPCTVDEVCRSGVCSGGRHDPYSCAALLCQQWTALVDLPEEISPKDRYRDLADGLEGLARYQVRLGRTDGARGRSQGEGARRSDVSRKARKERPKKPGGSLARDAGEGRRPRKPPEELSRKARKDRRKGRNDRAAREVPSGLRTAQSYLCARASLTGESWPEQEGAIEPVADVSLPPQYRLTVNVQPPIGLPLVSRLLVSDRFGTRTVAVSDERMRKLSLPVALASGAGAMQASVSSDRRKCYDVRGPEGRSRQARRLPVWRIEADPVLFDVRKLRQVCVPVEVNGVPVLQGEVAVSCYDARRSKGQPKPETTSELEFRMDNGAWVELREGQREYLCVPAVVEALHGDDQRVSSR